MQKYNFDIVKNYDNIVMEMETDPFNEIIKQYSSKMHQISKHMMKLDSKVIHYSTIDHTQINNIKTLIE